MCFCLLYFSEEFETESRVDVRCYPGGYTAPTWEKSWKWVKGSKFLSQLNMLVCESRNILSLKILTFLVAIKFWRKWKWGQVGSKLFHINPSWALQCIQPISAQTQSNRYCCFFFTWVKYFEMIWSVCLTVQVTLTNNVHVLVFKELKFWLKSLKKSLVAIIL